MPERRLKVLVLSTFDGSSANVIRDFLFSFRLHSRHDYLYVFDCRVLDRESDFKAFDIILIFWSLDLLGPDLSEEVREQIRRATARKVLFLQDEWRDVRPINRIMGELGINIIFSCVAESDHDIFYPHALIPSLEATYPVLTGYVPRNLESVGPDLDTSRPLDIGYRSREVPFYFGDLGREKKILADRFQVLSAEHGLKSDISVRERDLLYGKRWTGFLRASRCVLGSASGVSVIDFTGEIRRNCERYIALHPDATYDEVKARFFADVDWKIVIDTVSPRMFEAAALGCTLVHHEGGYAGILQADEHYICVRRDYSNVDDVIDRIKDHAFCRRLRERAYADLVGSRRYTYGAFADRFDRLLARHVPRRRSSASLSGFCFYGSNYLWHRQTIVPYRDRFLILPSRRLLYELTRRILAKLPRGRYGPVLSRLIWNPADVATKTKLALGTIRRSSALRKIWRRYWCDRRVRAEVRLNNLMNDLVKIDIVRRARAGRLRSREPFRVSVDYDPSLYAVIITSVGRGPGGRGAVPGREVELAWEGRALPPGLASAVLGGRVTTIVWDHSALSLLIIYCTDERARRPRWVTVGLGRGGVYRFDALTLMCRRAPAVVGPAVLAMLRGARDLSTPTVVSSEVGE